jgi:hypothetical protein
VDQIMKKSARSAPADPEIAVDDAPAGKSSASATKFVFQTASRDGPEFRTWFRGEHTNFNPSKSRLMRNGAARDFVVKGWEPAAPFLTPQTRITAFGSCFASNISTWLARRNYRVLNKSEDAGDAHVVRMGEGMVNSFVIRQQFEWAWENKVFEQALWHGYKAEEFGYDEDIRLQTKKLFDETDVFILTFGLSEVWYDDVTQNVFWRTIPKDAYDPARHKFRVSSVNENRDNMRAIYDLIKIHRPDAKIIFTLSPVPLVATFRDASCITANCVSKSVLRVALDEIMRETRDEGILHYWPSYELMADVFSYPYKPDRRHLKTETLNYIMTLFEHVWCDGPVTDKPSLTEAWIKALAVTGELPERLIGIINKRSMKSLDHILENRTLDADSEMDAIKRKVLADLRDEWTRQDDSKAPKSQHRKTPKAEAAADMADDAAADDEPVKRRASAG